MNLLRNKVWSVVDIALLKWSCITFGMIAGALTAHFTRQHLAIFATVAILLAVKPAISYFGGDKG
jgi:hypothetical protein